ncbi:MAG: c-type cytochrome [Pseudomonadota bacterium]
MKVVKISLLVLAGFVALATAAVYSGIFNFAADDPHWGMTQRLIELARERSIATHAADISVPGNLADEKLIASGAGEFSEMCTDCHLAPGMKDTEMRTGLYPKPPNLSEHGAHPTPEQQFWIIKHGLKMTGMPAWGLTHDDERIWSMVAFLQKLPGLSPAAYHELIEAGEGGHHHEGMDPEERDETGSEEADDHAHHHEHAAVGDEHGSRESNLPLAAKAAAARVDDFQKLLASGDTNGAATLLEPAVLIYESGEVERSRAEYASHHLKADAAFLKGADVRVLSRDGNAIGDVGWIATETEIKTKGSKPLELITTETMVLSRGPQGWHVAHIHWSSRPRTE